MSAPCLCGSLPPPGDSQTYVNPNDPDDHVLSVGDWVEGTPGVSSGKCVRDALDACVANQTPITIVVWDQGVGLGSHCDCRIAGFAEFILEDYRLPSQNRTTGRFIKMVAPDTAVTTSSGYGIYRIMATE